MYCLKSNELSSFSPLLFLAITVCFCHCLASVSSSAIKSAIKCVGNSFKISATFTSSFMFMPPPSPRVVFTSTDSPSMIRTIAFWPLFVVVSGVVRAKELLLLLLFITAFHRVNSAPIRRADVDGVAGTRVAAMASAGVDVEPMSFFFMLFVARLSSSSFSTSSKETGEEMSRKFGWFALRSSNPIL